MFDLHNRQALVQDGHGGSPRRGDLGVRHGRIAALAATARAVLTAATAMRRSRSVDR